MGDGQHKDCICSQNSLKLYKSHTEIGFKNAYEQTNVQLYHGTCKKKKKKEPLKNCAKELGWS